MSGADPILHGRDAPMRALRMQLDAAFAGRGRLALISGEAGIGKSTLAAAIAREAEARGAIVTRGRAWEYADAPPYFPARPCLRAIGITAFRDGDAKHDEGAAFHLWEEVVGELARASSAKVQVWIIEDLHAADLGTLDLLTFLAQPLHAMRALVVATTRAKDPRLTERAQQRMARMARDGLDLRLEPLTGADVASLASEWAGRALPPASVQKLVDLTGGNPLFVVECARAFRAAGAAGEGGIASLPPTVRQVVLERFALLPDSTRAVLECAAVLGREFSAAFVARMRNSLPAQAIDALLPALRSGVVEESRPGMFHFSHALVQEAIEGAMTAGERTRLHARADEVLAPLGDGVENLVERARHALSAMQEGPHAYDLAVRARTLLEQEGAFDRAFALQQRIEEASAAGLAGAEVTLAERLHVARIAHAAGRHAEARRICDDLVSRARAQGDTQIFALTALQVGAELRPGVVDRSLVALLEEAIALVGDTSPALVCKLRARLAAALQPAPDPNVPIAMARRAISDARALHDDAVLLEVLETGGAALVDYAPLDERIATSTELRDLALRAGDRPKALRAHARLAFEHLEAGDFDAYDENTESMLAVSDELGHPRYRWRALLVASGRAVTLGQFAESDRHVVEVSGMAALTDEPALALASIVHDVARARIMRRDDELERRLNDVENALGSIPGARFIIATLRATTHARLERVEETRAALAIAAGGVKQIEADHSFRDYAAEAYALAGTDEQRRSMRDLLLPCARGESVGGHVPFTYEGTIGRLIGLLDASLGDLASAEARLRQALEQASARGHKTWAAQVGYELAKVLASAGKREEAAARFAAVRELGEELGMVGLVRAVGARAGAGERASTSTSTTTSRVVFVKEGEGWRVEWAGRGVRVRDTRGMQLLARLVERPDEEIHVLALASDDGVSLAETTAGDVVDERALREYRARIKELSRELEEAQTNADRGLAEQLRAEWEALEREVARAVGLGGRSRRAGSATERARVNVQRRVKDAIARIAEADESFGRFFTRAVRTGTFCCFRP